MSLFLNAIGCLVAGAMGTLIIVVGTLLYLMASTPEVDSRSVGFFGSVFFEATPTDSSSFMMNIGLADPLPLLVSVLAIAVTVFLAMLIHARLRDYRNHLLQA